MPKEEGGNRLERRMGDEGGEVKVARGFLLEKLGRSQVGDEAKILVWWERTCSICKNSGFSRMTWKGCRVLASLVWGSSEKPDYLTQELEPLIVSEQSWHCMAVVQKGHEWVRTQACCRLGIWCLVCVQPGFAL